MRAKRPLTLAQRAELLVREELDAPMRDAGFRRTRLVFRREHGACFQELRFDARVLVSGGASPPEGHLRGWVTVAPLEKSRGDDAGATLSEELGLLVASGVGSWDVPMTRGPKRKKIGAALRKACDALLAALEPIVDAAAVRALAHRTALGRWEKQLAWIARDLRHPSVRKDPAKVQQLTEARERCLQRIAELGEARGLRGLERR